MSLNAALVGQTVFFLLFVFIIFATVTSFILGKRKTSSPKIAACIGAMLGFVPPLALVYLVVLMFRADITSKEQSAA